jgi:hypothetical protein
MEAYRIFWVQIDLGRALPPETRPARDSRPPATSAALRPDSPAGFLGRLQTSSSSWRRSTTAIPASSQQTASPSMTTNQPPVTGSGCYAPVDYACDPYDSCRIKPHPVRLPAHFSEGERDLEWLGRGQGRETRWATALVGLNQHGAFANWHRTHSYNNNRVRVVPWCGAKSK